MGGLKMKFKKLLLTGILSLSILGIGAMNVGAEETTTFDQLTTSEQQDLMNAHFTEEQINSYSVEIARELIAEGAVSLSYKSEIVSMKDSGGITTQGTISESHMAMALSAAEVTSDRPGSKKFRLLGAYRWLNAPNVAFTDSLAMGWSNTADLTIPVKDGKPVGYLNENYETAGLNGRFLRSSIKEHDEISNSGGIGNHFNIRAGAASYDGTLNVYVYSTRSKGAFNTFFTYGHSTLKATPTFNYSRGWLSISPGISTDTKTVLAETNF